MYIRTCSIALCHCRSGTCRASPCGPPHHRVTRSFTSSIRREVIGVASFGDAHNAENTGKEHNGDNRELDETITSLGCSEAPSIHYDPRPKLLWFGGERSVWQCDLLNRQRRVLSFVTQTLECHLKATHRHNVRSAVPRHYDRRSHCERIRAFPRKTMEAGMPG
jgi:hypothetical protein